LGNDAYKQLQLDIYGELMDSVYLFNKHGSPISYELWLYLRHDQLGVRELAQGLRNLGGSRRQERVRLFEADVLGGRGPRDTAGQKNDLFRGWRRWILVRDKIYET